VIDEAVESVPLVMGRRGLKITSSKQDSTATMGLLKLRTKRDSVFVAFSPGKAIRGRESFS